MNEKSSTVRRVLSGGIAIAAVTASMVGAGSLPARAAATGCSVHALPDGGTGKAITTGGDPSGHYVTGRVYPAGDAQEKRTVIWRDGRILPGGAIPGLDPSINDITTGGVGVGAGWPDWDNPLPYVVRDGVAAELAGGIGEAYAISERGVIVGALGPFLDGVPVRWSSADAKPQALPMPGGATTGSADGIGEDGTVFGQVDGAGYLWLADGTTRLLPPPTVDGQQAAQFLPDSTAAGTIWGRAVLGDGTDVAMKYRIASGTYEKLADAASAYPVLGARDGSAVGSTDVDDVLHAVRYTRSGGRQELPAYPKALPGADYLTSSISADGHTIGGYTSAFDETSGTVQNIAVVWTCL